MKILNSVAQASSNGKFCGEYRAVVVPGDDGAVVRLQQEINGEYHAASGGWYLTTLLENPHDSISIDYGQNWGIDSGMLAIINEAAAFCATLYSKEEYLCTA